VVQCLDLTPAAFRRKRCSKIIQRVKCGLIDWILSPLFIEPIKGLTGWYYRSYRNPQYAVMSEIKLFKIRAVNTRAIACKETKSWIRDIMYAICVRSKQSKKKVYVAKKNRKKAAEINGCPSVLNQFPILWG